MNKTPLKRKHTAATFQEAWDEYFDWADNNPWYRHEAIKSGDRAGELIRIPIERPYSDAGFCAYHNYGHNYLDQMTRSLEVKGDKMTRDEVRQSGILSRARAKMRAQKFEGAVVGAFKENIIARELGMWDRTENKIQFVEQPLFGDDDDEG